MGLRASKAAPAPFFLPDQRWWTDATVAVVTGANRGLGFHIARGLAESGLHTVLTSRNAELGRKALEKLQAEGQQNVSYHVLDVTDSTSIQAFAKWIAETHKGVDVLVNNAGIVYNGRGPFGLLESFSEQAARTTLATNYQGVRSVTEALLPQFRKSQAGARIVNVSSGLGRLSILSPQLQERFVDPELTLDGIDKLAGEFVASTEEGGPKEVATGWPQSSYGVSKALLNAYTRVLGKELQGRPDGERIFVNAVSPGWCATDMGTFIAHRTPEEGADTCVYLALLPADKSTNGLLYKDRSLMSYYGTGSRLPGDSSSK